MLFGMLAGERPFRGQSYTDTVAAMLTEEPPPLPGHVPPALAVLVRRCLEKRPGNRFGSARDLALALEAVSPPPESTPAPAARSRVIAALEPVTGSRDGTTGLVQAVSDVVVGAVALHRLPGLARRAGGTARRPRRGPQGRGATADARPTPHVRVRHLLASLHRRTTRAEAEGGRPAGAGVLRGLLGPDTTASHHRPRAALGLRAVPGPAAAQGIGPRVLRTRQCWPSRRPLQGVDELAP